ncbi:MAG: hypothetical protein HY291_07685 [Planctomycetes bacterium]|nr:hypothetical protein [Planctomycetota bacterium]
MSEASRRSKWALYFAVIGVVMAGFGLAALIFPRSVRVDPVLPVILIYVGAPVFFFSGLLMAAFDLLIRGHSKLSVYGVALNLVLPCAVIASLHFAVGGLGPWMK